MCSIDIYWFVNIKMIEKIGERTDQSVFSCGELLKTENLKTDASNIYWEIVCLEMGMCEYTEVTTCCGAPILYCSHKIIDNSLLPFAILQMAQMDLGKKEASPPPVTAVVATGAGVPLVTCPTHPPLRHPCRLTVANPSTSPASQMMVLTK